MMKFKKIIAILLCFVLVFSQSGFAQIAGQIDISGRLSAFRSSFIQDKFRPLHLRYLSYDSAKNSFQLLLDKGDLKNLQSKEAGESSKILFSYFIVGVTLPSDAFWVNLRPDSPDNIIDNDLAKTDVGKILLEADLQLKKDTAKFTSPETLEGREYWSKLYKKAGEIFGSENLTIPTLTRPWIVPDEIIVRETSDNAYVYKATLKVMLEQDYLEQGKGINTGIDYSFKDDRSRALNEYASQLVRELIIPKLTKEINTSKRYAPLRQVYYSLILAQWFKQKFRGRGGFYSGLIDRKNLNGTISKEAWSKNTYFEAYQKSFKNGEYNIKESVRTPFGQAIRSYFSGGIAFGGSGSEGIAPVMRRGAIQGSPKIAMPNMPHNGVVELRGGNASSPVEIEVVATESFNDELASATSAPVEMQKQALNINESVTSSSPVSGENQKGFFATIRTAAARYAKLLAVGSVVLIQPNKDANENVEVQAPKVAQVAPAVLALPAKKISLPELIDVNSPSEILEKPFDLKRGNYIIYRYGDGKVICLDFRSQADQSMLDRLAYFAEQSGKDGKILSDAQLDDLKNTYDGHDYSMHDVARFFTRAEQEKVKLSQGEVKLREQLIALGILRYVQGKGYQATGELALISVSHVGSGKNNQEIRKKILAHENAHAFYLINSDYRQKVKDAFSKLEPGKQTFVRTILKIKGYDITNEELLLREYAAYFQDGQSLADMLGKSLVDQYGKKNSDIKRMFRGLYDIDWDAWGLQGKIKASLKAPVKSFIEEQSTTLRDLARSSRGDALAASPEYGKSQNTIALDSPGPVVINGEVEHMIGGVPLISIIKSSVAVHYNPMRRQELEKMVRESKDDALADSRIKKKALDAIGKFAPNDTVKLTLDGDNVEVEKVSDSVTPGASSPVKSSLGGPNSELLELARSAVITNDPELLENAISKFTSNVSDDLANYPVAQRKKEGARLIGPILRELAVPAAQALKEIKAGKQLAWFVKLPVTKRQLDDILDSREERTFSVLRDENSKPYLYLELGGGFNDLQDASLGHLAGAETAGRLQNLSESLGHAHPRYSDAEPSPDDFMDERIGVPNFILVFTGSAIGMSIQRSGESSFEDIHGEENVIRELSALGILRGGASSPVEQKNTGDSPAYLTRMATSKDRLNHSLSVIKALAARTGIGNSAQAPVILDIGVGWSSQGPVTTQELAQAMPGADIIGIDAQLPVFIVQMQRTIVLFNGQGNVIAVQNDDAFESGETLSFSEKDKYLRLAEQLRQKAGSRQVYTDENGAKIIFNPVTQYERSNLKFIKADLFNLGQAIREGAIRPAQIVRISNVIIPHYTAADIAKALVALAPLVAEGGSVLIGYSEGDDLFPNEEYLVYTKQNGEFILDNYLFSVRVDKTIAYGVGHGVWGSGSLITDSGVGPILWDIAKSWPQFPSLRTRIINGPEWEKYPNNAEAAWDVHSAEMAHYALLLTQALADGMRKQGVDARGLGTMVDVHLDFGKKPNGALEEGFTNNIQQKYLSRGVPVRVSLDRASEERAKEKTVSSPLESKEFFSPSDNLRWGKIEIADTSAVPDEIKMLLDEAYALRIQNQIGPVIITGGTARDFAIAVTTGIKFGYFSSTDMDFAILWPKGEEQFSSYDMKSESILKDALKSRIAERTSSEYASAVTVFDPLPGLFIKKEDGEAKYWFEEMLGDSGDYFTISRMAVERKGDSYVIFASKSVIEDLRFKRLHINIPYGGMLDGLAAEKMLGKWLTYRRAGFDLDVATCRVFADYIKVIEQGNGYDDFIQSIKRYAQTSILNNNLTDRDVKSALEGIKQKASQGIGENDVSVASSPLESRDQRIDPQFITSIERLRRASYSNPVLSEGFNSAIINAAADLLGLGRDIYGERALLAKTVLDTNDKSREEHYREFLARFGSISERKGQFRNFVATLNWLLDESGMELSGIQRSAVLHVRDCLHVLVDRLSVSVSSPLPASTDSNQQSRFISEVRHFPYINDAGADIIRNKVASIFPKGAKVIDLLSGMNTYLPKTVQSQEVVGIGLNAGELINNRNLTGHRVMDLNKDPVLPFEDGHFDAAMMVSGMAYLFAPEELFSQVRRTLKPGAVFFIAFNDQFYTDETVSSWRAKDERERVEFIRDLLMKNGFQDVKSEIVRYEDIWSKHPGQESMYIITAKVPVINNASSPVSLEDVYLVERNQISGVLDKWFSSGNKRDFDREQWEEAIKSYPQGKMIAIQDKSGQVLGIRYFHKGYFLANSEQAPELTYIGDYIEVDRNLRGSGLGNILVEKTVEMAIIDPEIKDIVLALHPASDSEYAKEGKRAVDFFKKLGFVAVIDPLVEDLPENEQEKLLWMVLHRDQAEFLIRKLLVTSSSANTSVNPFGASSPVQTNFDQSKPYNIRLENLAPDRWLTRNEDAGIQHEYRVITGDKLTVRQQEELFNLFNKEFGYSEEREYDFRSSMSAHPSRDTMHIVALVSKNGNKEDEIAGAYAFISPGVILQVRGRAGAGMLDYILVAPDYRGTGAVDLLFEDLSKRFSIGDNKITVHILREGAPVQGEVFGSITEVKKSFGIRSKVTVFPNAGGIDFRSMPITAQPMANAGGSIPYPLFSGSTAGGAEFKQINNMIQAGIIPSSQRIKELVEKCYESENYAAGFGQLLICLAQVLRMEEDRCESTEPAFKQLLVLLESDKRKDEFKKELNGIRVLEKEPKTIE